MGLRAVPKELKKIDGVGVYQLENGNVVLARSLSSHKSEVPFGIERLLVPFRDNNENWVLRLDRGFKTNEHIPKKDDFSDFSYLEGFANFPKVGEIVSCDYYITKDIIAHDFLIRWNRLLIDKETKKEIGIVLDQSLLEFYKPLTRCDQFFKGGDYTFHSYNFDIKKNI